MISRGWSGIRRSSKNLSLDDGAGFAGESEFEEIDVGDDAGAAFFGEGDGGLDFGKHGAGLEVATFFEMCEFVGGNFADGDLVFGAVIDVNVLYGGDGNENVGFCELGEFLGGKILVNDGIDAFKTFQNFGAVDGDATTAGGDDDDATFDERGDGALLDYIDRPRRRYDATPAAAGVFFDCPAFGFCEHFGGFCIVKFADGFFGALEGRVVFVYYDLGNDGGDLFVLTAFQKSVVDGLGEPVADLALAHGDGGFEGHGGGFFGGGRFFVDENIADLGAVAVGDDNFVFAR